MSNVYKLADCTELIFRGVKVIDEDGVDYYEINMKNFNGNIIEMSEPVIKQGSKKQIIFKKLEKGDIIMPIRATVSNKIALFDLDTDLPCIVNHQYFILRPKKGIVDSHFLLYFLLNNKIKEQLNTDERNISKTGIITVNIKTLEELEIEIPDMSFQKETINALSVSQKLKDFIKSTEDFYLDFNGNIASFSDKDKLNKNIQSIDKGIDDLNALFNSYTTEAK